MSHKSTKILSLLLCFLLIFEQSGFAQIAGQVNVSGYLTQLRNTLVPDKFRPLHLRYLAFDATKNNFQLLLDKGDNKKLSTQFLEESSSTLLKYFFIGVTLPNSAFWVNLRPDREERIIDEKLGQTDVGKILLEADLQLKKDTAKFTSPETSEGKEYWNKLYKKAGAIFGSSDVTIPTLTRPWIVPDEIIVRETPSSAYVYKATLKVMLEQDYLKDSAVYKFDDQRLKELNEYSSELIRELIIPKITKEINNSKRYAALRQVYYSLILSQWFKDKCSQKGSIYAGLIDQENLSGLTSKESWSKTTYFNEYQKSFKDGEYNIKEPVNTLFGRSIRSYFSGGIALEGIGSTILYVQGNANNPLPASEYLAGVSGVIGESPIDVGLNIDEQMPVQLDQSIPQSENFPEQTEKNAKPAQGQVQGKAVQGGEDQVTLGRVDKDNLGSDRQGIWGWLKKIFRFGESRLKEPKKTEVGRPKFAEGKYVFEIEAAQATLRVGDLYALAIVETEERARQALSALEEILVAEEVTGQLAYSTAFVIEKIVNKRISLAQASTVTALEKYLARMKGISSVSPAVQAISQIAISQPTLIQQSIVNALEKVLAKKISATLTFRPSYYYRQIAEAIGDIALHCPDEAVLWAKEALERLVTSEGLEPPQYLYPAEQLRRIASERPELISPATPAHLITALEETISPQRANVILLHGLPCWRVYYNSHFLDLAKKKRMSDVDRYSLALAAHRLLAQHKLDTRNDANIAGAVDFIYAERENPALKQTSLFSEGRQIINILHSQGYFEVGKTEEMELNSGANQALIHPAYKGIKKKKAVLQDIQRTKGALTIFFNGHGGVNHLWLDEGEQEAAYSQKMDNPSGISYMELADCLLQRGDLSRVIIINDSCFSYNFNLNLINELQRRGAKELPVVVSTANFDLPSKLDVFQKAFAAMLKRIQGSPSLHDLLLVEEEGFDVQDLTIVAPVNQARLQQFLAEAVRAPLSEAGAENPLMENVSLSPAAFELSSPDIGVRDGGREYAPEVMADIGFQGGVESLDPEAFDTLWEYEGREVATPAEASRIINLRDENHPEGFFGPGFHLPRIRLISRAQMNTLVQQNAIRQGEQVLVVDTYWNSLSDETTPESLQQGKDTKLNLVLHEAMASWCEQRGVPAEDIPMLLEGLLKGKDGLSREEDRARQEAHQNIKVDRAMQGGVASWLSRLAGMFIRKPSQNNQALLKAIASADSRAIEKAIGKIFQENMVRQRYPELQEYNHAAVVVQMAEAMREYPQAFTFWIEQGLDLFTIFQISIGKNNIWSENEELICGPRTSELTTLFALSPQRSKEVLLNKEDVQQALDNLELERQYGTAAVEIYNIFRVAGIIRAQARNLTDFIFTNQINPELAQQLIKGLPLRILLTNSSSVLFKPVLQMLSTNKASIEQAIAFFSDEYTFDAVNSWARQNPQAAADLVLKENVPLGKLYRYLKLAKRLGKERAVEVVKQENQLARQNGWQEIGDAPQTIPQIPTSSFQLRATDLVLVHRTDHFPAGGVIKSFQSATGSSRMRNTVHFTLNHSVVSNDGGNWDNKAYTIIIPLHLLPKEQIENMKDVDTWLVGDVQLPKGAIVLGAKGSLQPEGVGEAAFEELEQHDDNAVINAMKDLGYTVFEGGWWSWRGPAEIVPEFGQRENIPLVDDVHKFGWRGSDVGLEASILLILTPAELFLSSVFRLGPDEINAKHALNIVFDRLFSELRLLKGILSRQDKIRNGKESIQEYQPYIEAKKYLQERLASYFIYAGLDPIDLVGVKDRALEGVARELSAGLIQAWLNENNSLRDSLRVCNQRQDAAKTPFDEANLDKNGRLEKLETVVADLRSQPIVPSDFIFVIHGADAENELSEADSSFDLGAQVSGVQHLDRLLRLLNLMRRSQSVAGLSVNASDREVIEFAIEQLRKANLVYEVTDELGNKIIRIKQEAFSHPSPTIKRLALAIQTWVIKEDAQSGVKAINFQDKEGTWTIVGFENELHNPATLLHEQREVELRKQGLSWIDAHNQTVQELGEGQTITQEEAQAYPAGRQQIVGAMGGAKPAQAQQEMERDFVDLERYYRRDGDRQHIVEDIYRRFLYNSELRISPDQMRLLLHIFLNYKPPEMTIGVGHLIEEALTRQPELLDPLGKIITSVPKPRRRPRSPLTELLTEEDLAHGHKGKFGAILAALSSRPEVLPVLLGALQEPAHTPQELQNILWAARWMLGHNVRSIRFSLGDIDRMIHSLGSVDPSIRADMILFIGDVLRKNLKLTLPPEFFAKLAPKIAVLDPQSGILFLRKLVQLSADRLLLQVGHHDIFDLFLPVAGEDITEQFLLNFNLLCENGILPFFTLNKALQNSANPAKTVGAWKNWNPSQNRDFDPKDEVNVYLEYDRFLNNYARYRAKEDELPTFALEWFRNLLGRFKNKDQYAVSAESKTELSYTSYEVKKFFDFVAQLKQQADKYGRKILLVPNFSYGWFLITPIRTQLEELGVVVVDTRVGSTEAHDDEYLIAGADKEQMFDDETLEFIIKENPIIVMADGSNSFMREGVESRYPDSHKAFVNNIMLINYALAGDNFLPDAETFRVDPGYIQALLKQSASQALLEKIRSMMEKNHISGRKNNVYGVRYFNPNSCPIVLTMGGRLLKRKTRGIPKPFERKQVQDLNYARGSDLFVTTINTLDKDMPDYMKEHNGGKPHKSGSIDDHIERNFIVDETGVNPSHLFEEEFKKQYALTEQLVSAHETKTPASPGGGLSAIDQSYEGGIAASTFPAATIPWQLTPLADVTPLDGVTQDVATIGDIHADLQGLRDTLEGLGYIKKGNDENGLNDEWIAENVTVVQGGDAIDRGHQSLETLEYLRLMQQKALAKNSKLIRIIGNHELMYLLRHTYGEWDGAIGYYKEIGAIHSLDQKLWDNDTELVESLREDISNGSLLAVYERGGKLFSHGIVTAELIQELQKTHPGVDDPRIFAQTANQILQQAVQENNFENIIFSLRLGGIISRDIDGITSGYFRSLSDNEIDGLPFDEIVFHDYRYFDRNGAIGVKKGRVTSRAVICADVGMASANVSGRAAVVFKAGRPYASYSTFDVLWQVAQKQVIPVEIIDIFMLKRFFGEEFRMPRIRLISREQMNQLSPRHNALRSALRILVVKDYWEKLSLSGKLNLMMHEAMADWCEVKGVPAGDIAMMIEGLDKKGRDSFKDQADIDRQQAHMGIAVDRATAGEVTPTGFNKTQKLVRLLTQAVILNDAASIKALKFDLREDIVDQLMGSADTLGPNVHAAFAKLLNQEPGEDPLLSSLPPAFRAAIEALERENPVNRDSDFIIAATFILSAMIFTSTNALSLYEGFFNDISVQANSKTSVFRRPFTNLNSLIDLINQPYEYAIHYYPHPSQWQGTFCKEEFVLLVTDKKELNLVIFHYSEGEVFKEELMGEKAEARLREIGIIGGEGIVGIIPGDMSEAPINLLPDLGYHGHSHPRGGNLDIDHDARIAGRTNRFYKNLPWPDPKKASGCLITSENSDDKGRYLFPGDGTAQGGMASIDVVEQWINNNNLDAIAVHLTQAIRDFSREQAIMTIDDVLARLNPAQQSLLMDIASPWLASGDRYQSDLAEIILGRIGGQTQQIVGATLQSPNNQTSFIPRPAQISNPVDNLNKGGIDPSAALGIDSSEEKQGGIDFRALPIVAQPMAGIPQRQFPLMDKPIALTETVSSDADWQEIDQMVKSGIVPSYQRIKDYLEESCKTKDCQQKVYRVLSCITDILRLEEEEVSPTQPVLREILVLLESGQSADQLQIALAKIEIPEEEPTEPVEP